jgi:hypothetical protein
MTKNLKEIVLQGVEHRVTEIEYGMLRCSCFPFYGPQPGDKKPVQNVSQLESVTLESTEDSSQKLIDSVSRAGRYVPVHIGSNPSRNLKLMARTIRDFCNLNNLETPTGLDKDPERVRQAWKDLHSQYGPHLPHRRIYTTPYDDVSP